MLPGIVMTTPAFLLNFLLVFLLKLSVKAITFSKLPDLPDRRSAA
jgi:hypothetical protein